MASDNSNQVSVARDTTGRSLPTNREKLFNTLPELLMKLQTRNFKNKFDSQLKAERAARRQKLVERNI
jgi:hypothetical protein